MNDRDLYPCCGRTEAEVHDGDNCLVRQLTEKLRGLEQISLTDGELAAAISESGWVLNGKGAEREFALLARAVERRVVRKIKDA